MRRVNAKRLHKGFLSRATQLSSSFTAWTSFYSCSPWPARLLSVYKNHGRNDWNESLWHFSKKPCYTGEFLRRKVICLNLRENTLNVHLPGRCPYKERLDEIKVDY